MTTEKQRLKKMAEAKRAARRQANQVRLTLEIAESRKDFADRWEKLRSYAGRVAFTYCARRLKQYTLDQIGEIRDEGLSEAWRLVCNGLTPEKAIESAINALTRTAAEQIKRSQPLEELPEHREDYLKGQERANELIAQLPKKLQPIARLLSTYGIDKSNSEYADLLECSEGTIRNYKKALQSRLGDRFRYWLLTDLDYTPSEIYAVFAN